MERLNRVYAVLAGINEVIVRIREPNAVFTAACTIATEKGGFRMAWIGTLDQNGTMREVAHAGDEDVRSVFHPETLAAQALAERRPILADDPGRGQTAALPFSDGGPLSGAFVLYSDEPGFFGADEVRLLENLHEDMEYGLQFARQESALRSSEQRFRTLFESAGDGIVLMDGDVFVACNQMTLGMFGCPQDRITGRHASDLSPPVQPAGTNSKEEFTRLTKDALGGQAQRFEWKYLRCDGTPFDAEVTLNRVDVDNKPYLQAIIRDITERKRLAQEGARLTAIIESTPDYVGIATPDGMSIYLNDSFRRILSPKLLTELAEGRGISITKFHPKSAAELIMDTALPYAVKHGYWQGENMAWDSQGNEFAVLQTVITHTEATGKLEYFSVVLRDISTIKQREHDLAESELRFRSLVENSSDVVMVLAADGKRLYVSPNIIRFTGRTVEETEEVNPLTEHIHPEDRPAVDAAFQRIVHGAEGSIERLQARLKHKDGHWLWIQAVAQNGITEAGLGGVAVNLRDITDLHEAQERLSVSLEQLKREHTLFTTAQRAGHIGIWYSDPDQEGKLVWTDETYQIFGLTKETFDGRVETFFKSIHPDDLAIVQDASTKALDPKIRAPYAVEHRIVRPDGTIRWVLQEGEVFWGPDGKPGKFTGVVLDTTTLHGAAAAEVRASDLERLNKLMVGREVKMVELKKENEQLKGELAGKARP